MNLLGTGELVGLKARGLHKLEKDPILRNQRIRTERQRAHMRALITVPPKNFPRQALARVTKFHIVLTRVAPVTQQLVEQELAASLEPVRLGVVDYIGHEELTGFEFKQAQGPWGVRFSIFDASPTLPFVAAEEP